MNQPTRIHLFQGYCIELEYMIVDKETLAVLPITDELLKHELGVYGSDFENGLISWSNELVLHVVELKATNPGSNFSELENAFGDNIKQINKILEAWNAMLLPTASHPFMDPLTETKPVSPKVLGSVSRPYFDPTTGLNVGPPLPASAYQSVQGYDAFNPGTNFHDTANAANRNGIVFFPGSSPLYRNGALTGGFGVSGDGVDQDDVVTAGGAAGFEPDASIRIDQTFVRGIRVPYQKFNRNPQGGLV